MSIFLECCSKYSNGVIRLSVMYMYVVVSRKLTAVVEWVSSNLFNGVMISKEKCHHNIVIA